MDSAKIIPVEITTRSGRTLKFYWRGARVSIAVPELKPVSSHNMVLA